MTFFIAYTSAFMHSCIYDYMRNRPDEIDQVKIAWENAQDSIRQEIGVMSMRSFADLYYARVQAERISIFRKPTQVQKKGT